MGERITTDRARELLAKSTPGRWFQTIDGDLCAGEPDDCENVTDPEYGCIVAAADFHLFAAAPDLAADLIDARAQIAALTAERDGWIETARRHCRNEDYYRGLVQQIGAHFPESYITDAGELVPDVLCAKVPEVVAARLAGHAAAVDAERARCIAIARGCVDYSGGHSGPALEAYHHGMDTVANALAGPRDSYQTRVVESIGRTLTPIVGAERALAQVDGAASRSG